MARRTQGTHRSRAASGAACASSSRSPSCRVMAFLYYRPISSYLQTRTSSARGGRRSCALRAEKARLERRFARTTSDAALAREARRIGYVKPGERLFIVKGIAAWQRSSPVRDTVELRRLWTIATLVERQIGRRPRAFRRVAARCPYGLPAVTEQEPYDAEGAPFPTTYYLTCPHLVAAVSRLEAAGGVERWSAAVAASPELRADLDAGDRGAAAGPPRARGRQHGVRSTARRSTRDRRLAQPGPAQVPARARRVRARASGLRLGELVLAEVPEPWPAAPVLLATEEEARVVSAGLDRRASRLGGRQPPLRARLPRRALRPSASAASSS